MDATTLLAPHLPRLRRYAQALTNSRSSADCYVRATLRTLLVEPASLPQDLSPRAALYAVFHRIWSSVPREDDLPIGVSSTARPAVLLMVLESFTLQETAAILHTAATDVLSDVVEAHRTLKSRPRKPANRSPSSPGEWRADRLRAA